MLMGTETIHFPLPSSWLVALKEQVAETTTKTVQATLAQLPRPVTEYSVPTVADAVDMAPDTVRRYMNLPAGHPQRLDYQHGIDGNKKLDRITLAQFEDWQRRRGNEAPAKPLRRPARRRPAA